MIALLNVPLEDEYLWKCTDPSTVIEHTLKNATLCLLELGCTFITTPETKGRTFYPFFAVWAVRCNSAIFSLFTHTFPPNYFAAVKDVVTNCLNTNCVSKQISAVSESFGKYREWQHWLSIWAQLFSSLVGTHKHVNMMTDARTHTHTYTHTYTAVSGLGVQRRHLNSAVHTYRRWNCSVQTWHDMKPWLENRSHHRLYSLKCYCTNVSVDETCFSLTARDAPQMVNREMKLCPEQSWFLLSAKKKGF